MVSVRRSEVLGKAKGFFLPVGMTKYLKRPFLPGLFGVCETGRLRHACT